MSEYYVILLLTPPKPKTLIVAHSYKSGFFATYILPITPPVQECTKWEG